MRLSSPVGTSLYCVPNETMRESSICHRNLPRPFIVHRETAVRLRERRPQGIRQIKQSALILITAKEKVTIISVLDHH